MRCRYKQSHYPLLTINWLITRNSAYLRQVMSCQPRYHSMANQRPKKRPPCPLIPKTPFKICGVLKKTHREKHTQLFQWIMLLKQKAPSRLGVTSVKHVLTCFLTFFNPHIRNPLSSCTSLSRLDSWSVNKTQKTADFFYF